MTTAVQQQQPVANGGAAPLQDAHMPVYLLTWHAYATWLPDRGRGYVHRRRGLQAQDIVMGNAYRGKMRFPPRRFEGRHQQIIIDAALVAGEHQRLTLHLIATDPSHAHLLTSWRDDRTWRQVRPKLKESLTRALNIAFPDELYPPHSPPSHSPPPTAARHWPWFSAKGIAQAREGPRAFQLPRHRLPSLAHRVQMVSSARLLLLN